MWKRMARIKPKKGSAFRKARQTGGGPNPAAPSAFLPLQIRNTAKSRVHIPDIVEEPSEGLKRQVPRLGLAGRPRGGTRQEQVHRLEVCSRQRQVGKTAPPLENGEISTRACLASASKNTTRQTRQSTKKSGIRMDKMANRWSSFTVVKALLTTGIRGLTCMPADRQLLLTEKKKLSLHTAFLFFLQNGNFPALIKMVQGAAN
jgi:hypothetical protein